MILTIFYRVLLSTTIDEFRWCEIQGRLPIGHLVMIPGCDMLRVPTPCLQEKICRYYIVLLICRRSLNRPHFFRFHGHFSVDKDRSTLLHSSEPLQNAAEFIIIFLRFGAYRVLVGMFDGSGLDFELIRSWAGCCSDDIVFGCFGARRMQARIGQNQGSSVLKLTLDFDPDTLQFLLGRLLFHLQVLLFTSILLADGFRQWNDWRSVLKSLLVVFQTRLWQIFIAWRLGCLIARLFLFWGAFWNWDRGSRGGVTRRFRDTAWIATFLLLFLLNELLRAFELRLWTPFLRNFVIWPYYFRIRFLPLWSGRWRWRRRRWDWFTLVAIGCELGVIGHFVWAWANFDYHCDFRLLIASSLEFAGKAGWATSRLLYCLSSMNNGTDVSILVVLAT